MRSRWIYSGGEVVYAVENGVVTIDKRGYTNDQSRHHMVMPDIQPYQSMADGSMIMSRSQHREHLKRHNLVEVGNDSSLYRAPKPLSAPPGLKDDIIRAVNEIERRSRR